VIFLGLLPGRAGGNEFSDDLVVALLVGELLVVVLAAKVADESVLLGLGQRGDQHFVDLVVHVVRKFRDALHDDGLSDRLMPSSGMNRDEQIFQQGSNDVVDGDGSTISIEESSDLNHGSVRWFDHVPDASSHTGHLKGLFPVEVIHGTIPREDLVGVLLVEVFEAWSLREARRIASGS
jgi:hypothetical protein